MLETQKERIHFHGFRIPSREQLHTTGIFLKQSHRRRTSGLSRILVLQHPDPPPPHHQAEPRRSNMKLVKLAAPFNYIWFHLKLDRLMSLEWKQSCWLVWLRRNIPGVSWMSAPILLVSRDTSPDIDGELCWFLETVARLESCRRSHPLNAPKRAQLSAPPSILILVIRLSFLSRLLFVT